MYKYLEGGDMLLAHDNEGHYNVYVVFVGNKRTDAEVQRGGGGYYGRLKKIHREPWPRCTRDAVIRTLCCEGVSKFFRHTCGCAAGGCASGSVMLHTYLRSSCLNTLVVWADSLSGITTLTVWPQRRGGPLVKSSSRPCFKAVFKVSWK